MSKTRRLAISLGTIAGIIAAIALAACGGGTASSPVSAPAAALVETHAAPVEQVAQPRHVPVSEERAVVAAATDIPARTIDSFTAAEVVAAYEEVLSGVYESALPSVVYLRVERMVRAYDDLSGDYRRPEGLVPAGEGSGFVWSAEGHVVTNHHVIASADRVTVIFADGAEFEAKVVGSDAGSDLAILKIDTAGRPVPALEMGDSGALRVGQLSLAIGNPFGQEFTMSRGIVSALGRAMPGVNGFANSQIIQTDTHINPGNSGGPLLDRHGDVIGITAQIISNSGSSAGVGFAIPINTAKRIVPELIADGAYQHAYMGISGASLNDKLAQANGLSTDTRGTLIVGIVEGGPAHEAGLVASSETTRLDGLEYPVGGDVITGLDGTSVDGLNDLITYLSENNRPGDKLTVELLRDGEPKTVEVMLQTRPDRDAA